MGAIGTAQVIFRLEANASIGGGHLMRCLALARELATRGTRSLFACRDTDPQFQELVTAAGHQLSALPETAAGASVGDRADDAAQRADAEAVTALAAAVESEWVVADHYGLDAVWEHAVRASGLRVLAVDDLGRQHECDVLVDHNYHRDPSQRYSGAVNPDCLLLLGPAYALLRSGFYAPDAARLRTGPLRRVLVSLGSGDPTGDTATCLEALLALPEGLLQADVLFEAESLPSSLAERVTRRGDIRMLGWVGDPVEIMRAADLAIGAGGVTSWERCALGLPAMVITTAENQVPSMTALAEQGAIVLLGPAGEVDVSAVGRAISRFLEDDDLLSRMSERALELGVGATPGPARVADALRGGAMSRHVLRPMNESDLPLVLEWRNSARVREHMFTRHEITWDEHAAWFGRMQSNEDAAQFTFEVDGRPVGVVGFTGLADEGGVATWGFYLGEPGAPKGSGSRMLALALDHVFEQCGIREVRSEVIEGNVSSRRVHERLGFVGTDVEHRTTDGFGPVDVIVYAIDANTWRSRRAETTSALFDETGGVHDVRP